MKVVNIEKVGKRKVYDISVKDAEHYVLKNGVVTHNTGGMYSANQVLIIGKAQEKEGTELVGYNFTINIEKSRFVKEKSKFPFTVMWDGGIQKYSGLMDIAIEGSFVSKPSPGWYAKIDRETGEIGEKLRFDKTQTSEFWEPILTNDEFKSFINKKFGVAYGSILGEASEHDVVLEEDEDL